MEHTIITVLVTLLICGIAIAIMQVYKDLKGKIADLVLWKPSFFAVKPELVVKGGSIVWSQMGDANASIPTPGPVHGRPMFASFGQSLIKSSFTFLSKNSIDQNIPKKLGLQKKCIAVENTRNIKINKHPLPPQKLHEYVHLKL